MASYRMSTHKLGEYIYASTQPATVDAKTGKRTYRHVHWGRFNPDSKAFTPNMAFMLLTPEERRKYIFPKDWDISAIEAMAGLRSRGRQPQRRQGDRLYGDIWLLEQLADKLGLRRDLLAVFDGNEEFVNMLLTLAIFPYVTSFSYNRVPRWQRIVRAPSETPLTATMITRLTQSISTVHRDELFRLRAKRLGKNPLCAVDSTSRSTYGRSLSDVKWGKSKDRPDLSQINGLVVYSLTDHQPIYYRTFPGNVPDCRTFPTILKTLEDAGFPSLVLITDRGCETTKNLELCICSDQALITAMPANRSLSLKRILSYGSFDMKPASMKLDQERGVYMEQFEEAYVVKTDRGAEKTARQLKVNLYFDPEVRARQYKEQDLAVEAQQEQLTMLQQTDEVIEDEAALKSENRYFKLTIKDGKLTSFERNEDKLARERQTAGFFSLLTLGLNDDAPSALSKYRLRDEQEKYFEHMKTQMRFNTQDNWSEDGKIGRLVIMFVGLVLASYVRHVWKTTELRNLFDSPLAVLDEMRCIRAIEEPGHHMTMTPFVGAQLKICEAFGIPVLEECKPGYESKRVRQRGRPRKTPSPKRVPSLKR